VTELERLRELLGGTDIYLIDQLMKGRIAPGQRILDAGCGGGRNMEPLLRCGCDVWGVDESATAMRQCEVLARELDVERPVGWLSRQRIESLGFGDASFDVVICNAVLHFAADIGRLEIMLNELWRVLAPRGLFFARLATTIGIETLVEPLGGAQFRLPDGSTRLLVERESLLEWGDRLGGTSIEPLKTTVVDGMRAMTTWCLVKAA
jgi:SAM-dependent methyltransferase